MSTAKLERNQAEIFEQEAITAALGLGGCSSSRVQRESIPPLTNVRLQHSVMIRGAVRAPALCCTSPTGFGSSACLILGSGLRFTECRQETRGHALRDGFFSFLYLKKLKFQKYMTVSKNFKTIPLSPPGWAT